MHTNCTSASRTTEELTPEHPPHTHQLPIRISGNGSAYSWNCEKEKWHFPGKLCHITQFVTSNFSCKIHSLTREHKQAERQAEGEAEADSPPTPPNGELATW